MVALPRYVCSSNEVPTVTTIPNGGLQQYRRGDSNSTGRPVHQQLPKGVVLRTGDWLIHHKTGGITTQYYRGVAYNTEWGNNNGTRVADSHRTGGACAGHSSSSYVKDCDAARESAQTGFGPCTRLSVYSRLAKALFRQGTISITNYITLSFLRPQGPGVAIYLNEIKQNEQKQVTPARPDHSGMASHTRKWNPKHTHYTHACVEQVCPLVAAGACKCANHHEQ